MAKIMYVLKKNMNEKSDNFGRWFAQGTRRATTSDAGSPR